MAATEHKRTPYERYRDYVVQLEQSGKKFPVNQFGDVNFSKIADDCGNRRQWFSESAKKAFGPESESLEKIIAKDIRRLGSEFIAPKDPESALVEMADSKSKEASRLRSMLEQKSKENELLREQVEQLSAEVRLLRANATELSNQQALMVDSGRTFFL